MFHLISLVAPVFSKAMTIQQLCVMLDESVKDIKYGPDWAVSNLVEWYQGGTHVPAGNRTTFGFFNLSFEGEHYTP